MKIQLLLAVLLIAHSAGEMFHTEEDFLGVPGIKRTEVKGDDHLVPPEEKTSQFWVSKAQDHIEKLRSAQPIYAKAKNIILFLGDGMSLSTVAASRIYKGQMEGGTGEEASLSFERFPYSGLSKTYCVNGQVPDSACTATAYLCGVKTNLLTVGVNAKVNFKNCTASNDPRNQVDSIAVWAQKAGKSSGIVTTTTVTHASPSATYAHTSNRLWESDAEVRKDGMDPTECQDIASQLMQNEPGLSFNVILGGGRTKFLPKGVYDVNGKEGERLDGQNLIKAWHRRHPEGTYVTDKQQLMATDCSKTDYLLGLFQSSHLDYHLRANEKEQPSLAELTASAIKVLQRNDNGFFLFVEGGRIDHGHHSTRSKLSLDETVEFSKAVDMAVNMTDVSDTLIVITADHGHTMSIAGYPGRGNDILGLNRITPDQNGIPYTTLNYAVGPKQYLNGKGSRIDLTGEFKNEFEYPSYIKSRMGTHSGDDVGIFASGPYAHFFSGVVEQNTIPHLMAYASCIGNGKTHCNNPSINI